MPHEDEQKQEAWHHIEAVAQNASSLWSMECLAVVLVDLRSRLVAIEAKLNDH